MSFPRVAKALWHLIDKALEQSVDVAAKRRHRSNDDNRNKPRDKGIFDRRGAAIVGDESLHSRSRSIGNSGKSAAGIG